MADDIDSLLDSPDEFHSLLAQARTGNRSTIPAL